MNIIMLGAPGVGKGTQAKFISERLSIPVISTGNIIREAIRDETDMGVAVKKIIENGGLVSDDIIIAICNERLAQADCADGYILDGVPRTIAQAQALADMGIIIDRVISMEIDDEVVVNRLSGRRVCTNCGAGYHVIATPPKVENICDKCGHELSIRSDDEPDTIRNRLKIYHEQTEPLKEFYSKTGKLRTVNGDGDIADITRAIMQALEA